MNKTIRFGFTLVELLVVIAIIGILIALLLPAVQAAREASRRSACSNNLKQSGLAIQNHLAARKCFPAGSYWKPNSGIWTSGNEATWITFILPYLEEKSLYEKADWVAGSFGSADVAPNYERPITSAPLSIMRCPSSEPITSLWLDAWMRGNYVANNGIGPQVEWFVPPAANRMAGMFFLESTRSGRKVSYVTDGLTKTAFVSEILTQGKEGANDDARGIMHYPEGSAYHHNRTPNDGYPDQLRPTGCVNKTRMPCQESNPGRAVVMTARSAHAGGVNLLLGDGSVRFVNETISLTTWQALASPRGGETISGSF